LEKNVKKKGINIVWSVGEGVGSSVGGGGNVGGRGKAEKQTPVLGLPERKKKIYFLGRRWQKRTPNVTIPSDEHK